MMMSDDKVGGWVGGWIKKVQNHDDIILEWSLRLNDGAKLWISFKLCFKTNINLASTLVLNGENSWRMLAYYMLRQL